MGIPLEEVMKRFSPERQKQIYEKEDTLIKEYKMFQELQKSLDITANGSKKIEINVSNLKDFSDMRLSTLKDYVESMGCELEILIKTPDDSHVKINNFLLDDNM